MVENKELQGQLEESAYSAAIKHLGANIYWKNDFVITDSSGIIDLDNSLKALPKSEIIAARAIESKFRGYVHYISEEDQWYFWNGVVHMPCEGYSIVDKIIDQYYDIQTLVIDLLKDRIKEIVKGTATENRDKKFKQLTNDMIDHKRYRDRLTESAGRDSLTRALRKQFHVTADYFEGDRDYIVFADGQVINLRTPGFDLEPADRNRPVIRHLDLTMSNSDTYEQHTPFKWFTTLDEWLPNKDEQVYLQAAAGAAILGEGKAKNIPTLVGVSNTGKSTYIRTMANVFGSYAGFLPADAIVHKGTNFDQYKARGVRFLYLEEPHETRVDDSFLKNLSGGGGAISTQEKHKNTLTWKSQAVLHIAANHVPKVNTSDDAIVDRLNVIMFTKVFKATDSHTVDKLEDILFTEEGLGIFLWALEGAKKYREYNLLPVCDSIKARALNNISNSSLPITWLTDALECGCYQLNPDGPANTWVEPKEAYSDFDAWMFRQNEKKVPSKITWGKDIHKFLKTPENKQGKFAKSNGKNYLWTVQRVVTIGTCEHVTIPQSSYTG